MFPRLMGHGVKQDSLPTTLRPALRAERKKMKNRYFSTRTLPEGEREGYIVALHELTTALGLSLEEDTEADRVLINGEVVRQGMHSLNGTYMSRWYAVEHSNIPERIVGIAIKNGILGKKKIREIKRRFDRKYPPQFDRWLWNFCKGICPEWWVSKI